MVDEWTLCQNVPNAADILKNHWDSWVSLADFQRIANSGFNTVRIPVGYWAYQKVDGDPYIQGAAGYIDTAIGWARATGLHVWIDLHGAPGSQNGYDNSGHRISQPEWSTDDTIANTLDVLNTISSKYATDDYSDVVAGIELLNEPLLSGISGGMNTVEGYYRDGYNMVRTYGDSVGVVLHDGFEDPSSWNGFLTPSDNNSQRVIVDHHYYQVFTDQGNALQPWAHRQGVCNDAYEWAQNQDKWLVCGEWTAAMTDCAPYVNGYGIGSRYDGSYSPGHAVTGSCGPINDITQWDQTFKDDMRGYVEAQLEVFDHYTQGYMFWNFKTEPKADGNPTAPEWDLFALIDVGVFPQPLSDRKFSVICSM